MVRKVAEKKSPLHCKTPGWGKHCKYFSITINSNSTRSFRLPNYIIIELNQNPIKSDTASDQGVKDFKKKEK